jgi:hypothetical protein
MPHFVDGSTSQDAYPPGRTGVESETPFDNIESAHEFVHLLGQAIDEAIGGTAELVEAATADRHLDALRLVTYKLRQLRMHVTASSKLLNDLRTLRRLLLNERRTAALDAGAP